MILQTHSVTNRSITILSNRALCFLKDPSWYSGSTKTFYVNKCVPRVIKILELWHQIWIQTRVSKLLKCLNANDTFVLSKPPGFNSYKVLDYNSIISLNSYLLFHKHWLMQHTLKAFANLWMTPHLFMKIAKCQG